MVDEEHAVEMVDLMLEADREQAVDPFLMRLAVAIEPAGADAVGAKHLGIMIGHRQAAFRIGHGDVGAFEDLGIDEDARILDRLALLLLSGSCRSMTSSRFATPTWIAARPMPGAAYIVANMSSISDRSASSTASTGEEICRRIGSGVS